MKDRLLEFDRLRGLAIFGVVIIHSTVHCINGVNGDAFGSLVLIILNQVSRFSVPAFLVISGYFITKQEHLYRETTQQIAYKRIKRIIPPYLLWSSLYYILFIITGEAYATRQSLAMIFLEKLITGTVTWQLFFIVMIVQCYILCLFGLGRKGNISKLTLFSCITMHLLFIAVSYIAEFKHMFNSPLIDVTLSYFKAFSRSLFPMYISFFVFGRWLGANYDDVLIKLMKYRTYLSFGLIISFTFTLTEFFFLKIWTNGAVSLPQDWNLTTNIFAFIFILHFIPRLKAMRWRRINFILIWLANFSFILFLLHEPLLGYITKAFYIYTPYLTRSQLVLQPILLISVITISFLIYKCLESVLPKPIKHYLLG